MSERTVIFSANRGYALTSSRTALIRRFLSAGWQVVLATADDAESRKLCDMGARLEPVRFSRGGFFPLADIAAHRRLVAIYRKWRPELVTHFHAKPVIFGSLAARRALGRDVRVVNVITGLGHAFVSGGLAARLAGWGYQKALPPSDITIFQNRDDRALFLSRSWMETEQARLIAGSGVDMERFTVAERPGRNEQTPVVVMLGRLLRQKGIPEFIEVARLVKQRWPGARFLWAGEADPVHPDAVSPEWLAAQHEIEYVGRLRDVVPLFSEADLLLFPSYYREGVPRVILEASAMGLPTVGLDVPGVREAVHDGETGYLVRDQDIPGLTGRVLELLGNRERRLTMGGAARRMAEEKFDIRSIQEQYLEIYRELGIDI